MQDIRIEQRTFHGLFAGGGYVSFLTSGANAHSSIAGMGAFAEKRKRNLYGSPPRWNYKAE